MRWKIFFASIFVISGGIQGSKTLPDHLDLWLRATFRRGFVRENDQAGFAAAAAKNVRNAFPAWRPDIEIVLVSSPDRHSCQYASRGTHYIAIDKRQVTLMGIQDSIVRSRQPSAQLCETLAALLLAGAARTDFGLLDRSFLWTIMWHERAQELRSLAHAATGPGHSASSLFLLMHEAAHLAVDTGEAFVSKPVAEVRAALLRNLDEAEKIACQLEAPDETNLSGLEFDGDDPVRLAADMRAYLAVARNSEEEIVREAACDLVAAIAMLNLRFAFDFFAERNSLPAAFNLREAGDILGIALRCGRLLMINTAIRELAMQVAALDEQPVIGAAFAQMNARANITTNLFAAQFSAMAGHEKNGSSPTEAELLKRGFNNDTRVVLNRSTERLLEPAEALGRAFLVSSNYAGELARANLDHLENASPTPLEWQYAVDEMTRNFPI